MYYTTVGQAIFNSAYEDFINNHSLYVIREEDIIFYVGRTVEFLERFPLCEKSRYFSLPAHVSKFILDNNEDAATWSCDLLASDECKEYSEMLREHYSFPKWKGETTYLVDGAEIQLIRYLHPCFNEAHNPDPTPIPAKYLQVAAILDPLGWKVLGSPNKNIRREQPTLEERTRFIDFMRQSSYQKKLEKEGKAFQKDAIIYAIATTWLKPFSAIFYVGVTTDFPRRQREHETSHCTETLTYTPDDFHRALDDEERLLSNWKENFTKIKEGIVYNSLCANVDLSFSPLDTVPYNHGFPPRTASPTTGKIIPKPIIITLPQLQAAKKHFNGDALEREFRWIFKMFQAGYNLTNVQRVCTNMIHELRARPHFDVINTPFHSEAWNPIIAAYCQDEPKLRYHEILEKKC